MTNERAATELQLSWSMDRRWRGIERSYSALDVLELRGSVQIEHTLARLGAERFWNLLHAEPLISALGAMSGHQAIQQVQAGLKSVYVSGWQVAADANLSGQTYPDQSLYPCDSVPALVRRINNAFVRADQVQRLERDPSVYWYAPIIADAEAGFGGNLNAFELMKGMIEAGAAAVHFEDQLASAKKCGHMGGKVLVPVSEFIQKLNAARLAADIEGIPTLVVARTDARAAQLLTSDIDERDLPFLSGKRTVEGFFQYEGGTRAAIMRALAFAPYADILWFETSEPDLQEAEEFAKAILARYPGKLMAYNCSPSFNWNRKLAAHEIESFQAKLSSWGYRFQFVTLAGFHSLNYGMFSLAREFREKGMAAYAAFQERELVAEREWGYPATTHQRFVGTGYFDEVASRIAAGSISTSALSGSTEEEQFKYRT